MGKFDTYKIDLKNMQTDSCEYEYLLDNLFFTNIDAPEIQKGKVNVHLKVKKMTHAFELTFLTDGTVSVPCDRCLDDMDVSITSSDNLLVKFGAEYAEEDDNLVVIPEDEGVINLAWFMYEFIALAVPMKHVHAPGKCNKEMANKLGKLLRTTPDDIDDDSLSFDSDESFSDDENSSETPIDPRWSELKKILDNN